MMSLSNGVLGWWSRNEFQKIRDCGADAQLVALFLMANPYANDIGFYRIGCEQVIDHLSLSDRAVMSAIRALVRIDFCFYNEESSMVFIPEMAVIFIGKSLNKNDNRIMQIQSKLDAIPVGEPLLEDFYLKHGESFHLKAYHPAVKVFSPLQIFTQELMVTFKNSPAISKAHLNPSSPLISILHLLGIAVKDTIDTAESLFERKGSHLLQPNYVFAIMINQHRQKLDKAAKKEADGQSHG